MAVWTICSLYQSRKRFSSSSYLPTITESHGGGASQKPGSASVVIVWFSAAELSLRNEETSLLIFAREAAATFLLLGHSKTLEVCIFFSLSQVSNVLGTTLSRDC
jgi:hypothetical protein